MVAVAERVLDKAAVMAVLESVPDPEIPVLSITDLGIVRGIATDPPRVLISPTYTGCPATVAIETSIREALDEAGFRDVHVERVLFPPSTAECPQCGSTQTVEVSRFGATPCKAQWRCTACLEPFERFKCH